MKNLNENDKIFIKNEELLQKVSGGQELSDDIKNIWIQDYGQPDGSFKYVCPVCGKVIIGWVIEEFFDVVGAHYRSHLGDVEKEIPLPTNPYWIGK